jgi:hypothetical protein
MLMSVNGNLVKNWVVVPTLVGPAFVGAFMGRSLFEGRSARKIGNSLQFMGCTEKG